MMEKTIKTVEDLAVDVDIDLKHTVLSIELVVYCMALPGVKEVNDLDNIIKPDLFASLNEKRQMNLMISRLKEIKKLVSFKDDIDNFGVEYVKILGSATTLEDLEVPLSNLMTKIKKAAVLSA